jgi:hypothetical protein
VSIKKKAISVNGKTAFKGTALISQRKPDADLSASNVLTNKNVSPILNNEILPGLSHESSPHFRKYRADQYHSLPLGIALCSRGDTERGA